MLGSVRLAVARMARRTPWPQFARGRAVRCWTYSKSVSLFARLRLCSNRWSKLLRKTKVQMLGVFVVLLTLTGCVATPVEEVASATESPEAIRTEEPIAIPEPIPEPERIVPQFEGSLSLTDADGYTSVLDYSLHIDDKFTSDVQDEAPGFTAIITTVSSSLKVRNTTPERNYTITTSYVLMGLYPEASPICAYKQKVNGNIVCVFEFASSVDPMVGTAFTELGSGVSTGNIAFSPNTAITLKGVPEGEVDAYTQQLLSPAHFVLVRAAPPRPFSAFCQLKVVTTLGDGMAILASTPALEGCP